MKALLLSAYAAHSHVHWRRELQAMFDGWHWQVLELPPRHFSWRVRGNPLTWSGGNFPALREPHDLLIATSMVDLATLRGLVPALAGLPTLYYFHENQFAYPPGAARHEPLEAQMVSLYGALAADAVAFNSAYNRDSFLDGVAALARRLPDGVPADLVATLRGKSQVLPVPLAPVSRVAPAWPGSDGDYPRRPLRLLWSARLEHDKGGELLLQTLRALRTRGCDFELAVTGQQFRDMPAAFEQVRDEFHAQLVQFGFVEDREPFRALQAAADMVLSTARHEFQGLAVLEAVSAGCVPVVPDGLAYREIYPDECRYLYAPEKPEAEAGSAAAVIESLAQRLASGIPPTVDVGGFGRDALEGDYASLLQSLTGVGG